MDNSINYNINNTNTITTNKIIDNKDNEEDKNNKQNNKDLEIITKNYSGKYTYNLKK